MRRPMVLCSSLFCGLLFFFLLLKPAWWKEEDLLPETKVTVQGFIYAKEYKMQGEKAVSVLYLKDVFLTERIPGLEDAYDKGIKLPYSLMCYLKADDPNVIAGREVLLSGDVRHFGKASNPGGFDSARYYQILDIGVNLKNCRILKAYEPKDSMRSMAYRIREYCSMLFYAGLPPKEASVMASLLLGEKGLLDSEVKDLYRQNGIIHILAISGLHISLLGMGLFGLTRKAGLPKGICAATASGFLWFYCLATGFGPSSIRALVMFLLQMGAKALGRTYDMLTGVALAAFFILCEQPLYLFHSGFLLSFGSVISLLLLLEPMETLFPKRLAPGLAILFGTLPIHLCVYYGVATYSIFLNLLVVPCMPVVLCLGIVYLILGAVHTDFLALPGALIQVILMIYEKICEVGQKIPGSWWIVGKPSVYQVSAFLTVTVIVCLGRQKMPPFWNRCLLLIGLIVLTIHPRNTLQLTAVDVGQGDCFFVEEPLGRCVLIDGGSSDKKSVAQYQIEPFLKYTGVSYIEAVFLSHLDEDHCNGVMELLERMGENGITIGSVVLTKTIDREDPQYVRLMELAKAHNVSLLYMSEGDQVELGKLQLKCLYPGADSVGGGNENSMVLLVAYKGFRALFTGDLEGIGEQAVARMYQEQEAYKNVSVLKVAHHGSGYSTGEDFLRATNPKLGLISVGENNSYGHPHPETLERLHMQGVEVFRTDESGAVTIQTNGKKMTVLEWLKQ